jgi:predicted phosphohydrolase
MNIQFVSDLHLDQLKCVNSVELVKPESDVLILGGDICHIVNVSMYTDFFNYISDNFQYVLYIPGNHEFYNENGFTIQQLEQKLKNFLQPFNNIIYLNNHSVILNDILFTGSCLWCNPSCEPPPWFKINISRKEISNMYNESVDYLKKVSQLRYPKHIIITHYPPLSLACKKMDMYDDYYQNPTILLDFYPMYWIFGHIHKNMSIVNNCSRYLSNQRKGKHYMNNKAIFV